MVFPTAALITLLYRGACGSDARNSFAVTVDSISLSQNGGWVHSAKSSLDYGIYHNNKAKKQAHFYATSGETVLASFEGKSFLALTSIDGNCLSLLHLKFFHNLDDYNENDLRALKALKKCDGKTNFVAPAPKPLVVNTSPLIQGNYLLLIKQ